jgi:hypothetical protein
MWFYLYQRVFPYRRVYQCQRWMRFLLFWGLGMLLCLLSVFVPFWGVTPSHDIARLPVVNLSVTNLPVANLLDAHLIPAAQAAEPPALVSTANPPVLNLNLPKETAPPPSEALVTQHDRPSQTEMTEPSLWWAQQQFGAGLIESWRAYTGVGGQRRVEVVLNQQAWNRSSYLQQYSFMTQFGSSARAFGYSTWLLTAQGEALGQYICDFQPTAPNTVQTAAVDATANPATPVDPVNPVNPVNPANPASQLASRQITPGLLSRQNSDRPLQSGMNATDTNTTDTNVTQPASEPVAIAAPSSPSKCQITLGSRTGALRENFGVIQSIGGGIGR